MTVQLDAPVRAKFANMQSDRRVTAIIATRTYCGGYLLDPLLVDFEGYLAKGGTVLVAHDSERQCAWCPWIERTADRLVAEAIFPPPGIDATADSVFDRVWNRQIRMVSIAISFRGNRHVMSEWSFGSFGRNPECYVISGFKPDGGNAVQNYRDETAERLFRQYRVD